MAARLISVEFPVYYPPRMKKFRPRHKENLFRCFGVPKENLLCAIIDRAHGDLTGKDPAQRRDAYCWFTSRSTGEFSFNWMIEELKLTKIVKMLRQVAADTKDAWPASSPALDEPDDEIT